ncbi:MAG: NmrA family NAD(P)-binding protein [Lewinella sp.]|nr:NmrA family NAD(P)-binding protein [Lewinella sp.]
MILVLGATGRLGQSICRQLSEQPEAVRAFVRPGADTAKRELFRTLGFGTMLGDLREPASFDRALEGVQTVIATASSMPISYLPGRNDIKRVDMMGMKRFIDHARAAGVRRFIYISLSGEIELDFPLWRAKRSVEKYLEESGLSFTILRPAYFMETWLSPAVGFDPRHGSIRLYGDGTEPVSFISLHDVARFAVASVGHPLARNAVFELGGPEALSPLHVAHLFSELSGRRMQLQYIPMGALQEQWAMALDPMQTSLAGLMLCLAQGAAVNMRPALECFPLPLTSVEDYAASWLPAAPLAA